MSNGDKKAADKREDKLAASRRAYGPDKGSNPPTYYNWQAQEIMKESAKKKAKPKVNKSHTSLHQ